MINEQERQRIGARIAQLRREQQLTQKELGERCGLADTHIARIEKGRYSVGFDTLQAIAEGLNKTVDIV
jgi:transcriptional regulator with XRE-family HTH domain